MAIMKNLYDNKYIALYEEENIRIWGKIALYNSIFNEEYEVVTDVTITDNNEVIYEANNINMPYNKADLINISKYVEKIAKYLLTSDNDIYWKKIFLNKFFKESKTIGLELYYRDQLKEEDKQRRIKEAQETDKQIKDLKKEVQKQYNDKNYMVVYDLFNLIIFKNETNNNGNSLIQKQNDEYFKKFIFEGIKNENTLIKNLIVDHIELHDNKSDIKILKDLLTA